MEKPQMHKHVSQKSPGSQQDLIPGSWELQQEYKSASVELKQTTENHKQLDEQKYPHIDKYQFCGDIPL